MSKMHAMRTGLTAALVAAATVGVASATVTIQGGEVNISGATLFRDFFQAPASTNDWIDADGDGCYGFTLTPTPPCDYVDQIAESWTTPDWTGWWLVQYRSVGSGNGLAEFVNYQLCNLLPTGQVTDKSFINRYQWGSSAGGTSPYPGTSVDIAVMDVPTKWFVQAGSPGDAWWNRKPTQSGYGWNPIASYGDACMGSGFSNALQSLCRDCDGGGPGGIDCLNTNTAQPNEKTVFDTVIAWVPISFIANRGVALPDRDPADGKPGGDIKMSELQHLFVTGRMPNGENLVGATRDVGSGTRNGAMNSIGVDPGWGMGDNVSLELKSSNWANLGPYHQATNCGSSSIMELAVQNRRLAIGYSGTGGSGAAADANSGLYEMVNVMKDIDADGNGLPDGNAYVRSTIDAIVNNANPNTGWQVGGPETFATVGNPLSANPAADFDKDGDVDLTDFASFQTCFNGPNRPSAAPNCLQADFDGDADVDLADFGAFQACFNGPNRAPACPAPAMANDAAADYILNIVESIRSFSGNPPAQQNYNMPGEYLATNFTLTAGVDALPDLANPSRFIDQTGTPNFNQTLQNYILANSTLAQPVYGTKNPAGLVPTRRTLPDSLPAHYNPANCPPSPTTYADGTNGSLGYMYRNSTGGVFYVTGGKKLSARNAVQGDFNRDSARNLNDICAMMQAFINPLAFEQPGCAYCTNVVPAGGWSASKGDMNEDVVIVHVIGDFDGDGNFDAEDVRYFADGLAIDPSTGKLNRKLGFTSVDTCWAALPGGSGNFFNTTKAHGAYAAGDSRGDVAGSASGAFPGAHPAGADGTINGQDVNYVHRNVAWALAHGAGDWSRLDDAAGVDLSCDMNGDLRVDSADITEIVTAILGCCLGDLNLDGHVTAAEVSAISANIGMANPTYTDGDLDCDGQVTASDVAIANANVTVCP